MQEWNLWRLPHDGAAIPRAQDGWNVCSVILLCATVQVMSSVLCISFFSSWVFSYPMDNVAKSWVKMELIIYLKPEARHNNEINISISALTSLYVQTHFCIWERWAFYVLPKLYIIENIKKVVLVLALQPFFWISFSLKSLCTQTLDFLAVVWIWLAPGRVLGQMLWCWKWRCLEGKWGHRGDMHPSIICGFLCSPVWHASHESTLPHPQEPAPKAEIQKMVKRCVKIPVLLLHWA